MKYWLSSIATFGIGDFLTTAIGLSLTGIVEANPSANMLLAEYGIGIIIVAKLFCFVFLYATSKIVPGPEKTVPITLTILGMLIVLWNTHIILSVL